MRMPYRLLWLDGLGAFAAGAFVLLLGSWLSALYQLPKGLIFFIGLANMFYALYSIPLAIRSHRTKPFLLVLIFANLFWGVVCCLLAFYYRDTLSLFGMVHLLGEGIYVGGLGCLEWRWRELLLTNDVLK